MMLTDATRIMCACVERGNAGYGTVCVVCMHGGGALRSVREREMEHESDGAGRHRRVAGDVTARRVAGGVGHSICLSSRSHTEREREKPTTYISRACPCDIYPCNQQPFLRETCSSLHATSIIVFLVVVLLLLLAPRLDQILACISGQADEVALIRVIACTCLLFSVNLQADQLVGVRAVHPLKRSRIYCLLVNRKAVVFRSQLLCTCGVLKYTPGLACKGLSGCISVVVVV